MQKNELFGGRRIKLARLDVKQTRNPMSGRNIIE
jgi:hypothetical protein